MNYPLKMNFKIMAVAPQIFVRDANGQELIMSSKNFLSSKKRLAFSLTNLKPTSSTRLMLNGSWIFRPVIILPIVRE